MLPAVIPNSRILRFGYASQWLGKEAINQRLPLVSEELLRCMIDARRGCEYRPIVFVGHCFGGLVIEKVIKAVILAKLHDEDYPNILRSVAGIVFLGTPHRGSQTQSKASIIARIASILGQGEQSSLLKAVEKDSEMLNDLVHDFTRVVNKASIGLFCFFEQQKSNVTKILKPKSSFRPEYREIIVDESSGCIEGFPKAALNCDHFEINRCSRPTDQNFQFIQRIAAFVNSAPDKVTLRLRASLIVHAPSRINDDRDLAALNALCATEPSVVMDRIQNQKDKLLDDTGAWILGHPTFTTWLNVASSRTIWIHGDPGKGKTMLAISLVQELSSRISFEGSASTTAIACFFCDNKDSGRNTGTAILRGLIYQLICQRPELCVFLRDQYEKQKDQLFNSTNSLQSLWRIFQTITKKTGLAQIFVVIDALDECEPESLESFITLLDPEIETSSDDNAEKSTMVGGSRMKWLLTSRNELVIKQGLFGALEISLEANHLQVEDSVRKFIGVKIEQLRRRKGYGHQLSKFVEETLREKAEGTFLWVALACKELSKSSVLSVNTKNVLLRLPSGIKPLYGRILDSILGFEDKEIANYAKAILRSMVIAFRPLTLNELAIAASLPEEHHHDLSLLKEYVNVCGSLVTIRENIAYFVHLSAKDYILSNGLGSVLSPDLRADHQLLALNCFEHVSKKLSRDHTRTESLPGSELHQLGPEYPTLFWIQHARQSPSEIAESFDLDAEFFQSNSAQRQAWLDEYWTKSHAKWESKPRSFTALHLVSYAGLTPLLQKLLVKLHLSDIAAQDSLGNTPLLWAAKNGFEACVILLVKMGASVATENREGMTALQWAAVNGHEAIVKYLFEHNASIETKDRNGWAPLHRAAYNGHTNVVKLLVKLGADVETLDGSTWTAMHRAATMGQTDVVRFLIDMHASTGPLDREGMTPMLHAAWAGQHEVMRLFFDCGMDVDSRDYNGWTALHNAAWNGHVSTVKFLLDREASVQVKNSDGSTPLHHATWSGHADVVQLLVKAGADVDAKAFDEDETPLQQAAWHGHHSCVDLLLKAKAEVNMQNAVGHTALHQAASNGRESVVRLLLEYEADLQIIDKHGQTARALAEANEHETTAFILKERMAALEAFSEGTRTPVDFPCLDEAVAAALGVDPMISTVQPHQAAGFFVPEKITTVKDGKQKFYYMKSGGNKEMFESEYIALSRLHETVPTLAPQPITWGKFSGSDNYYLVTEWIDEDAEGDGSPGTGLTLAQKVAQLHNTLAPVPSGHKVPMFGFPITTYCGSTPQKNEWNTSWAHFFAENRLRSICRIIEENHGTDEELVDLLEKLIRIVVPRLLGNGRLGGKVGIKPVLIHGDLWEGNRSKGRFDYRDGMEPVTYDPACCYGHSEFELGIMRMFGGFSAGFFNEYHHLVPKTEPKKEYDDRMGLYELYHYLNHYAIYSGGYREDAIQSMKKLCAKYSND